MRGISGEQLEEARNNVKLNWDTRRAIDIVLHLIPLSELQEPWITIDSARKDGTRYLLFNIFWEAPCTGLFDGRQWVLHSDLPPFKNQPTHYQELPIHKPEPLR